MSRKPAPQDRDAERLLACLLAPAADLDTLRASPDPEIARRAEGMFSHLEAEAEGLLDTCPDLACLPEIARLLLGAGSAALIERLPESLPEIDLDDQTAWRAIRRGGAALVPALARIDLPQFSDPAALAGILFQKNLDPAILLALEAAHAERAAFATCLLATLSAAPAPDGTRLLSLLKAIAPQQRDLLRSHLVERLSSFDRRGAAFLIAAGLLDEAILQDATAGFFNRTWTHDLDPRPDRDSIILFQAALSSASATCKSGHARVQLARRAAAITDISSLTPLPENPWPLSRPDPIYVDAARCSLDRLDRINDQAWRI